jgi:glycosyltransferase involved in cell wall biosynthesis
LHTNTAGETNLLMVGSLVAVKGHAIAIRAFAKAQLKQSKLHLHIVGDGPLRRELIRLARDLQVFSCITFHGHVEYDDLPDFYHAADFCLMTSYFESTAMVILEAASCERVTIGTAVGLLPEITPSEYCVTPGDFNSLAERILQLCSEPCKIRELGRRAANIVEQKYTLRHMEQRFEAVYEEVRKKFGLSGPQ